MERVAFLIEDTGERIDCLLNPESMVVRRLAGVQPRRSVGGPLTGSGLADDPLLFTGGGMTELTLDLLFDVSLAGASVATDDVRDFTGPFWHLAENAAGEDGYGQPPLVRFVWGKAWNVPAVVAAVAERFEQFTPAGVPQRSWLRMRLLRVEEPTPREVATPSAVPSALLLPAGAEAPEEGLAVHEVLGSGGSDGGERLDEIASRYYGNPALWRLLAQFNNIADPMNVPPGTVLRIPPLSVVVRSP